ncbi:snapalysin family zinc-dependent metalloprotease [Streptomyces sodiiphilus]|uniref:Extracellular small neutral protease n=1 Tax=Streptomyces sodiiphilus TaxID=226217 RepID=A0ABP5ACK4_9ACTN
MFLGKLGRAVLGALLLVTLALAGAPAATAAPAPEAPSTAAVVLTYDASGAAEFTSAVHAGAQVWNASVSNVELRPVQSGQQANIRVYADNGWPRAYTSRLGNGYWYMGRQAVNEGYDTIRIAAHEFGHLLGLPDVKPGPCSSLMSGSSAGVSCTNRYPNAQERAAVERRFG